MTERIEHEALEVPKMLTQLDVQTTPEDIKEFTELRANAQGRYLEPPPSRIGEDTPDALKERVQRESLVGTYWQSGEPGKMAMFKLLQARTELDGLGGALSALKATNEEKAKTGILGKVGEALRGVISRNQGKVWEGAKRERETRLKPVLLVLGLNMPQTDKEAWELKKSITSPENHKRLKTAFETSSQQEVKDASV